MLFIASRFLVAFVFLSSAVGTVQAQTESVHAVLDIREFVGRLENLQAIYLGCGKRHAR
jgi:hypothetical protein